MTAGPLLACARLFRLHQPIGFLLLAWPALWGLWLAAEGWPGYRLLLLIAVGVFAMRAAGCAINDYFDRGFDRQVKRTAQRPLAQAEISPKTALICFFVLLGLAIIVVLQLPRICLWLAIPGALLTILYPLSKRYSHLAQLVLGLCFGLSAPIAYAAVSATLPPHAWLLYIASVLWIVAYDTAYAISDREEDRKLGLHSTAILFGDADRLAIALLLAAFLGILLLIGIQQQLGGYYYAGLGLALWSVDRQQRLLATGRPLQAFRHNHYLGMLIFIGLFLHYQNNPIAVKADDAPVARAAAYLPLHVAKPDTRPLQ